MHLNKFWIENRIHVTRYFVLLISATSESFVIIVTVCYWWPKWSTLFIISVSKCIKVSLIGHVCLHKCLHTAYQALIKIFINVVLLNFIKSYVMQQQWRV